MYYYSHSPHLLNHPTPGRPSCRHTMNAAAAHPPTPPAKYSARLNLLPLLSTPPGIDDSGCVAIEVIVLKRSANWDVFMLTATGTRRDSCRDADERGLASAGFASNLVERTDLATVRVRLDLMPLLGKVQV